MRSIKFKLFIAISGLVVLYVLLSWLLNSQFLVDYYYQNKENTLRASYESINKTYTGQPIELALELERVERTEGLHVIILNTYQNIKYISGKQSQMPIIPEIFSIQKAKQISPKGPLIVKSVDRRLNSEFINLIGILNNGDYIFLSTPVIAIEESAEIANKFFLITGLITILTGLLIVFLFAGRFTKPILQLNEIAQRMAKLDFSKKYDIKTYDEIGELGESLNSLSTQLEKSITELRQANEKLMEDIEKERKIDDMRKEFISNVSHELKTPIALIQGYAEGLKVNVNETEEDKNFYCDVIIDESAKMNKLVKQLLDLSQIDTGYARLNKTDFDLTQLVQFVLKKNVLLMKENNIELITDMEDNLNVNADIDRIEQVVVNYLVNAINHVDEKRTVKVRIYREGNKAKVTIFNTGDHIPAEDMERIWISFYKVDKARTRSYGGTGLGLSIVRAIQELHQNRYGVENIEEGVTFWFEVALAEENDVSLRKKI